MSAGPDDRRLQRDRIAIQQARKAQVRDGRSIEGLPVEIRTRGLSNTLARLLRDEETSTVAALEAWLREIAPPEEASGPTRLDRLLREPDPAVAAHLEDETVVYATQLKLFCKALKG